MMIADPDFYRDHVSKLRAWYARAPFLEPTLEVLLDVYSQRKTKLADLTCGLTIALARFLGFATSFKFASEFTIPGDKYTRPLGFARILGCSVYLTQVGTEEYTDIDAFAACGIKVEFLRFQHPEYRQLSQPFVPHLSIVDMLMNIGPEQSAALIEGVELDARLESKLDSKGGRSWRAIVKRPNRGIFDPAGAANNYRDRSPASQSFCGQRVRGAPPERAIEKFEREVAVSLGVAGAVAVSSGTAALHLALLALGIGERDEVIVPTYACVSLLHAVHASGARPVPVDNEVSLEDFQLAPTLKLIERGITRRTKAIIAVHTFGSVARVVSEGGLGVPMIEDFTLSLGARLNDCRVGSWGSIAVASLHASKMISAGQGGIVVSQDKRLLEKVRELSSFEGRVIGWRRMSESRLQGTYTRALNYQMSGLQATLALSQWKQLPRFIKRRLQLARRYSETFTKLGISCPNVPKRRKQRLLSILDFRARQGEQPGRRDGERRRGAWARRLSSAASAARSLGQEVFGRDGVRRQHHFRSTLSFA